MLIKSQKSDHRWGVAAHAIMWMVFTDGLALLFGLSFDLWPEIGYVIGGGGLFMGAVLLNWITAEHDKFQATQEHEK